MVLPAQKGEKIMSCDNCRGPLICPMCRGDLQLAADGEMMVCVECGYVRRVVRGMDERQMADG